MDRGDPTGHWGRQCWDTGTTAAIVALHELAGAPLRAPRGVAARVFRPKMVRGHRGCSPWVQRGGDDFKVVDSGGLNFPSFNGVAQPHPRSSGPKDGIRSFLVLSSRSSPSPIASGGGELAHAMTA
jgi:hypothetical protein